MNEEQWENGLALHGMLRFVIHDSPRRVSLLACGIARYVWEFLNPISRELVDTVDELFNESCGDLDWDELDEEIRRDAVRAPDEIRSVLNVLPELFIGEYGADHFDENEIEVLFEDIIGKPRRDLIALLRDIFGNPFRPVTLDPRWLTSTVIDLARTIYGERVWERMPILADALMDAGCDSDEIINHCRSNGPHVRGCWVVDLLLSKE